MHSAVLRTCAAFVFLSFAVIFHTPQNASQDPPASEAPSNERVWLAVEEQPRGRLRIEPIATVKESNLTPVQTSCQRATIEQPVGALALAREIFSEHGIPEALLPKVRAEYVTRTYLAPSPQPSLIGSFSLDTGDNEGLVHTLFFVANQPGEKLIPELLWLRLSEMETDEEHLRFVDHADLFGNGQDEIVAKLVSLQTQTHRYLIFRRTRDGAHWEQVFKTEPRLFVVSRQRTNL
jgi:hypothetical protein